VQPLDRNKIEFFGNLGAQKDRELTTVDCFEERARRASRQKFEAALAKVPDVAPAEEDWLT